MTRIENRVAKGMPDVEGCLDGAQLWLELKSASRPRGGGALNFEVRAAQVAWHTARAVAGGVSYFLIGVGPPRRLYLIPGVLAERLTQIAENDLAALSIIDVKATREEILRAATQPWAQT